jgi:hypothetical protein
MGIPKLTGWRDAVKRGNARLADPWALGRARKSADAACVEMMTHRLPAEAILHR